MATPQEIQRLLAELQRSYERLGQTNPFENFDTSSINDTVATARQLESALTGVRARINEMDNGLDGVVDSFRRSVDEIKNQKSALGQSTKALKGLQSIAQKLKYDQEGISRLSLKELQTLQKQAQQRESDLRSSKESLQTEIRQLQAEQASQEEIQKRLDAIQTINSELDDQLSSYNILNDSVNARVAQEENINKALGATPAILGGIGKQLQKLGLPDFGIDDAVEKTKEILRDEEGRVTAGKALSVFSSQMKKNLLAQVTPANLIQLAITEIFTALKGADQATGELAKNMNMTYSEASAMRMELNTAANLSGDVFVNTKGMQESLMAINNTLGTNVMLNEQNLVTFTKLREAAGFTNEELMGMQSLANATGGNLEDMTGEFLAQARITATQNKAVLNEKQLMKEISQVSAATTLSFSKNPGLIAEAVSTAKSLGMEMSKVESIADSLLQFESSIENELQAELLLGKNINLEKARQAALNNDLKTVAEEIAKQAGSSEEFARMNRIQQEALAGAVGMSREELAKSLFLQEQIGNVSADDYTLRKKQVEELEAKGLSQAQIKEELAKTSVKDLQNQASVQDRLNASVEKLREVFISIADPIMAIVSPVIDMLIPAIESINFILSPIIEGFKLLSNLVKSFVENLKEGQPIALALASIMAIMARRTIVAAIGGIFQTLSQIPFGVGLALAGVATAGLISLVSKASSQKVGDLNSPAKGKTQISTKEGGLFELSPNDDVIAAPGAARAMARANQQQPPVVVQNDNTESKRTNMLLEQILTKQGTVKMDATEVGTAFSVNTYNVQ